MKPNLAYTLSLEKSPDYTCLSLRLMEVFQYKRRQSLPVPTFNQQSYLPTVLLRWQATNGQIRHGTVDGPAWYGFRCEVETERLEIPAAFRWLSRNFPDGLDRKDLAELFGKFSSSRIPQLALAPHIHRLVKAEDWDVAEQYRVFRDDGINPSGCIVNAFVHMRDADDPERIADAVAVELRSSPQYCSDAELVRWIQSGRKCEPCWTPCYSVVEHNRPVPIQSILGRPEDLTHKAA